MVQEKKKRGKTVRYNFKQHITWKTQSQSMSTEDTGQPVALGCKKKHYNTCNKNKRSALNEICLLSFLSEHGSFPTTFKEVSKHISKRMWQCLPSVIQTWKRFNHLAQLPCPIQSLDLLVIAARSWTNVLTGASPLVLLSSQWECLIKGEIKLGMQTSSLKWQELAMVNSSCKTPLLRSLLDLKNL